MPGEARKELIEYRVWISRTSVLGRFRSPELVKIDALLKAYELNGGSVEPLKTAFRAWSAKAGADWRKSKRNADGVMEELWRRLTAADTVATPIQRDASHARLGLIYLFAHTKVDSGIFKLLIEGGFDLAGNVLALDPVKAETGELGAVLGTGGAKGAKFIASTAIGIGPSAPPANASAGVKSFWERLKEYLSDYAGKVFNNLKAKFAAGTMAGLVSVGSAAWGPVTGLINLIVGKLAAAAAPFIGGAFTAAAGLKTLIVGIYDRYSSYSLGKNVVLASGHPQVVVDSVHRAMNFSIGRGLYETLKSAGSIGMAAASFGGSAVVDLIIAACEIIANFVHRIWETSRMNSFFGDCALRWKSRGEASGIQNSPTAFAGWYRAAAVAIPAISALALNSGITGDKMQYLQMFNSGENAIQQKDFDRGIAYLDNLKGWSHDYLADTGYSFQSDDKMIASILTGSTNKDFVPLTTISGPMISGPSGGDLGSYGNKSGLLSIADAQKKFGKLAHA